MRIAVIGAGGVGGYFGARLAAAGHDVAFLARGENLKALRSGGLALTSPLGDLKLQVKATDDAAEVGPCEVVLFCVKGYATAGALPLLRELLGVDGSVVCLQNGMAAVERVAAAAGRDRTLGGAAYISCHLRAPGVLEHHPGPASIVLGGLDGGPSPRAEAFAVACREAGVAIQVSDDVTSVLWTKLALICGLAGATATTRLPIGEIRSNPACRAVLRGLIDETVAVGRAAGATLPDDLTDTTLAMLDSVGPGMVSSLSEDLVNGRPMELDDLHGDVLRRAATAGIDTPTTRVVHGILAPWAVRTAPEGTAERTAHGKMAQS
jgi:2-dehydropantoate 2-reductase